MQNESQLYSSISEQYIVPRLRDSVTTAEVCGLLQQRHLPEHGLHNALRHSGSHLPNDLRVGRRDKVVLDRKSVV